MREKTTKRAAAVALAAIMLMSASSSVLAADSWPSVGEREIGSVQPRFSGYRVEDIANWSPETDPYAEDMRAMVPLQKRNDAFKATQANPELDSNAQIMLMQGDYGNGFFDSYMYNNSFSENMLNYWQYTDYYSPWHGAATSSSPKTIYDPATSDWRDRGFEFGTINIPNPAYTNAAHKNGALSIACIYFDQAFRPGQSINEMFRKDADGSFIVAKKLIAMAEYYGYDGYFYNCEETPDSREDQKAFLAELTAAGLWTQYYDTNSSFNESKAQWLSGTVNGQANTKIQDSVFVNYNWDSYVDQSLAYAEQTGVNPFDSVFMGAEANQDQLNGKHNSARNITSLYETGTKNPRSSIALFTPSDFYQRGLDDNVQNADSKNFPLMQTNEYQWMIAERERMYFSGPNSDPTNTGKTKISRPEIGLNAAGGWVGVADFTSERSVVDGGSFYTNFNTGHGMQYAVDGETSVDNEWSNINIQDILPSWQWWVDTDGSKLSVDFDYGKNYKMKDTTGKEISAKFEQVGAYEGGSSLVLYGNLDEGKPNEVHLYKTDLAVVAGSKASVTFKKTSDDQAELKLGLIFKDAPDTTVELALDNSKKPGDWTTSTVDLSAYNGREIAAMTLIADGKAEGYQMNVGEIKVTDGQNHTPAKPTGFSIDNMYGTGEAELSWDLSEYDTVKQYNVYATKSDGTHIFLNGIYDDNLYIKSLFGEDKDIKLELRAVGEDGSESEPAVIDYNLTEKVSNVKVEEAETSTKLLTQSAEKGALNVSWTAPKSGSFDSYELSVKLLNIADGSKDNKVYTQKADKDATSAQIIVPVAEGYQYVLSVSTVKDGKKSAPICYSGSSKDCHAAPLLSEEITDNGSSLKFRNPKTTDWYKLHVMKDGKEVVTLQRGKRSNTMSANVSGGTEVSVVLEDYSGNMSVPTVVRTAKAPEVVDAPLTEAHFPDANLLAAVKAQVGDSTKKVDEFKGTLDLSGKNITDLTGIGQFRSVESINLSGNTALELVKKDTFTGCENLKELSISGCTGLKLLEVPNLGLEKLNADDPSALQALVSVDLSGNAFDLSEGTPEQKFVKAVEEITKDKEDLTVSKDGTVTPLTAEILTDDTAAAAEAALTKLENLTVVSASSNIGNPNNFVDGDLTTDTDANKDRNKPATVVIDLGAEKTLGKWEIYSKLNDETPPRAFGIKHATLEVSATGTDDSWKLAGELNVLGTTANVLTPSAAELDTPVKARYVKVTIDQFHPQKNSTSIDWPAMNDLFLYETDAEVTQPDTPVEPDAPVTYPAGVAANLQRPVAYPHTFSEEPMNVAVEAGKTMDLKAMSEEAVTVRGNDFTKLSGAFLDPDYKLSDNMPDNDYFVKITDRRGNVTKDVIDLSEDNTYQVEFLDFTADEVASTMKVVVGSGGTGEPENPDSSAPSNPDSSTPSNPDSSTPSNPDSSTPSNPDSSTPSNPDSSTPSNPDSSTPSNPDSSTSSADPSSDSSNSSKPGTTSKPSKGDSPKTGDQTPLWLFGGAGLAAAGAAVVLVKRKNRKQD